MKRIRNYKFRMYPTRGQKAEFYNYLNECAKLWNFLLEQTKEHHEKTGEFPTRKQLYLLTKKKTRLFSQVSQNIADRLSKTLNAVMAKRRKGEKVGFPRFKPSERIKSFTYPQFGFKIEKKLHLSKIGKVMIKKHRKIRGKIKTLTIKKTASGKWYAILTSEIETAPRRNKGPKVGIDLGIENFVYSSDGTVIENPRHLKKAKEKLKQAQRLFSRKRKGSKNRERARLVVARTHEKVVNGRMEFLHKTSRMLVEFYSSVAMENLNVKGLGRGFLAKHVLDCS